MATRSTPVPAPAARLLGALLVVLCALASACAHQTVIRTEPEGAQVFIDGNRVGAAPVIVERPLGTAGEMEIRVELEAFEPTTVRIERSEWFLWPALLAMTPFLAVPTVVIPVFGPFLCGGWALLTSPSLISLAFLRRFPAEVTVPLSPRLRVDDGLVLPTDDWTVPDDYTPNPLPPLPEEEREPEPPSLPQTRDPTRPEDKAPNPPPTSFLY